MENFSESRFNNVLSCEMEEPKQKRKRQRQRGKGVEHAPVTEETFVVKKLLNEQPFINIQANVTENRLNTASFVQDEIDSKEGLIDLINSMSTFESQSGIKAYISKTPLKTSPESDCKADLIEALNKSDYVTEVESTIKKEVPSEVEMKKEVPSEVELGPILKNTAIFNSNVKTEQQTCTTSQLQQQLLHLFDKSDFVQPTDQTVLLKNTTEIGESILDELNTSIETLLAPVSSSGSSQGDKQTQNSVILQNMVAKTQLDTSEDTSAIEISKKSKNEFDIAEMEHSNQKETRTFSKTLNDSFIFRIPKKIQKIIKEKLNKLDKNIPDIGNKSSKDQNNSKATSEVAAQEESQVKIKEDQLMEEPKCRKRPKRRKRSRSNESKEKSGLSSFKIPKRTSAEEPNSSSITSNIGGEDISDTSCKTPLVSALAEMNSKEHETRSRKRVVRVKINGRRVRVPIEQVEKSREQSNESAEVLDTSQTLAVHFKETDSVEEENITERPNPKRHVQVDKNNFVEKEIESSPDDFNGAKEIEKEPPVKITEINASENLIRWRKIKIYKRKIHIPVEDTNNFEENNFAIFFDKTSLGAQLIEIITRKELKRLVQKLKTSNITEIGVHMELSLSSFTYKISVLEISTKDEDYIIDCLAVNCNMEELIEIFLDSKIRKVFNHTHVIEKLQYHFGVEFVNVFVICLFKKQMIPEFAALQQTCVLKLVGRQRRPSIFNNTNSALRPLSFEQKQFCRLGSHYLLPIYQSMMQELLKQGETVCKAHLKAAENQCKFSHETQGDYLELNDEIKKHHENQLRVLIELDEWRNSIAVSEKISAEKVLRDKMMQRIAINMPDDMATMVATASSPFVSQSREFVFKIINPDYVQTFQDSFLMKRSKNKRPKRIRRRKRERLNLLKQKEDEARKPCEIENEETNGSSSKEVAEALEEEIGGKGNPTRTENEMRIVSIESTSGNPSNDFFNTKNQSSLDYVHTSLQESIPTKKPNKKKKRAQNRQNISEGLNPLKQKDEAREPCEIENEETNGSSSKEVAEALEEEIGGKGNPTRTENEMGIVSIESTSGNPSNDFFNTKNQSSLDYVQTSLQESIPMKKPNKKKKKKRRAQKRQNISEGLNPLKQKDEAREPCEIENEETNGSSSKEVGKAIENEIGVKGNSTRTENKKGAVSIESTSGNPSNDLFNTENQSSLDYAETSLQPHRREPRSRARRARKRRKKLEILNLLKQKDEAQKPCERESEGTSGSSSKKVGGALQEKIGGKDNPTRTENKTEIVSIECTSGNPSNFLYNTQHQSSLVQSSMAPLVKILTSQIVSTANTGAFQYPNRQQLASASSAMLMNTANVIAQEAQTNFMDPYNSSSSHNFQTNYSYPPPPLGQILAYPPLAQTQTATNFINSNNFHNSIIQNCSYSSPMMNQINAMPKSHPMTQTAAINVQKSNEFNNANFWNNNNSNQYSSHLPSTTNEKHATSQVLAVAQNPVNFQSSPIYFNATKPPPTLQSHTDVNTGSCISTQSYNSYQIDYRVNSNKMQSSSFPPGESIGRPFQSLPIKPDSMSKAGPSHSCSSESRHRTQPLTQVRTSPYNVTLRGSERYSPKFSSDEDEGSQMNSDEENYLFPTNSGETKCKNNSSKRRRSRSNERRNRERNSSSIHSRSRAFGRRFKRYRSRSPPRSRSDSRSRDRGRKRSSSRNRHGGSYNKYRKSNSREKGTSRRNDPV